MKLLETAFLFPSSPGSVHASTLVRHRGSLFIACFCGTRESADDVDILVSRDFGAPVRISAGAVPHWNPVLYSDGQTLTLWFKTGRSPRVWTNMRSIYVNGEWTPPVPVEAAPVKNKPVSLSDGTLAMPSSVETAEGAWFCRVYFEKDGVTAHTDVHPPASDEPASPERPRGIIQPTLWEDGGGLHMLARSTFGCLYRADAADLRVFCEPYPVDFPNNNSGVDLVRANGKLYLAANPVPENWGARTPLTVSESDDGLIFNNPLTLEDGRGEFSYPSIIAAGGELHVAYTHNRTNIKYAKIGI